MQTTVVTGFSGEGYEEYGRLFMSSFKKHNPNVPLHIYTDGVEDIEEPNVTQFEQSAIKGLSEFLDYAGGNPKFCGKPTHSKCKEKEVKAGYSYRFDAFKFCKMVYTMWAAAHNIGEGYMIWLDGDNVSRQPMPDNMAEISLPNGEMFAYLGREPKHTETGYLAFKLPEALPILDEWMGFYGNLCFQYEKEWHSAFLFDRARERHPSIKGNNLTPGGRGHVMANCWVGEFFMHNKGKRKKQGKSPEAKPLGTFPMPRVR